MSNFKNILALCIVICTLHVVHGFNDSDVTSSTLDTYLGDNGTFCNNATLQKAIKSRCCWCTEKRLQCVLYNNNGMEYVLSTVLNLSYTFMENMTFFLNNSWQGHFPVIEIYHMNLTLLQFFPDLLNLRLVPSQYQTHSVPMDFTNETFEKCNKIEELHINIPLQDTDILQWMVKPLVNLKVLDFNNVRGISYKNMNKTMNHVVTTIEELHLSHFQSIGQTGYLTVLITYQFFRNNHVYPNLTTIELSDNGFALVYTNWFRIAPNLKHMDISHNGLTFSTNTPFLIEVLMHPTIEILNISHQGFYDELNKFGHFQYEPEYWLKCNDSKANITNENDLDDDLDDINLGELFPGIISYETLNCTDNMTHGNISELFNTFNNSEVFCDFLRNCTFPSWAYISCDNLPPLKDIYNSDCETLVELPLGENLREVHYSHNFLDQTSHNGVVLKGNICLRENNSLQIIDFSYNYFWANNAKIAESISTVTNIINGNKLQQLNLNKNDFNLSMTKAAVNFPNLAVLNMSGNFANLPSGDVSLCETKNIHSLTELDLSFNQLHFDNLWGVIRNCSGLTSLNLAGNKFDDELNLNLKGTDNLKFIHLGSNQIQKLSTSFIGQLEETKQRIYINISDNNLICGCKSLDFIKWVKDSNRRTFIVNYDGAIEQKLLCSGNNGLQELTEVNYIDLWKECSAVMPIIISLSTSIAVITVGLLITCIWRRRFLIRYKYFKLVKRMKGSANDEHAQTQYNYDAFVSYSSLDEFWVRDVLMKELEETYRFQLFMHERDIAPGHNIRQEVDENLSRSREHILVMTDNFLKSEWCTVEMEEAELQAHRRGTYLIIIVLGEKPKNIQSATANRILQQYNYLQWRVCQLTNATNDTKSRKLFWEKLVYKLYGSPNTCWCCSVGPGAVNHADLQEAGNLAPQVNNDETEPLLNVASDISQA